MCVFFHLFFPLSHSHESQFSCSTYDGWLEHSKQIKHIAETEMESSCRMRESLFVARERTKNSLESQQEMTEHTLRKRIFDTQRARNEFEWQIIKVNLQRKYKMSFYSRQCSPSPFPFDDTLNSFYLPIFSIRFSFFSVQHIFHATSMSMRNQRNKCINRTRMK